MLVAAAVMAVVIFFGGYELEQIAKAHIGVEKAAQAVSLLATILLGAGVYLGLVWVLCPGEVRDFVRSLRKRKRKGSDDETPPPDCCDDDAAALDGD